MSSPKDKEAVPEPNQALVEDAKAKAAETIAAILERIPAKDRLAVKGVLERSSNKYFSSQDPEIVRLLGILASLESSGASGAQPYSARRSPKPIRVTVALVPTLQSASLRATVLRRPDDGGRPILLLRESDATAQDLVEGLKAAAFSVKQFGETPTQEQNISVRRRSGSAPTRLPTKAFELLKASATRELPGIGRVRFMEMAARVGGSDVSQ